MENGTIGIAIHEPQASQTLELVLRAEELGVPAVWLTTGPGTPDATTLFAAAAVRTDRIKFGTAIVPTYPRHPIVLAQQTLVVGQLAPGRFRLGVGPSHRPTMEKSLGLSMDRPLEHTREYVVVLKTALGTGAVDFAGKHFRVKARLPGPVPVPVLISGLRPGSFRLAGEVADGVISWVCPAPYLRDVAMPALRAGASQAGRPNPPLVAHAFVCISSDRAAAYRVARERLATYPRLPFYAEMFALAGFPEARQGTLSDGMIDAVFIHGDEAIVAEGLRSFMRTAGASEIIASVLPVGEDPRPSYERAMRALAAG